MDIRIEKLPKLPQGIIEAYERRELAVFVGAGISRLMGCQGWDQMANSLIEKVCPPATAEQIISCCQNSKEKITIAKRIAEKESKKEREFWKIFHAAIKPKKNAEDIYAKIANLDALFLTTNCDGLLVRHYPNSYTVNCTREVYNKHSTEEYVFCLHGNWGKGTKRDKDSLIFTEDKYLSAYQPGNPLPTFLQAVMREKTVLFIGYGLNEFEIINAGFEPAKAGGPYKHYVLEGFFDFQKELCNAKAEYYASINVNLIAYSKDDNGYKQQAKIISEWIEELKGKTSYNSRGVRVITDALDEFTDNNRHIVEQKLSRTDSLRDSFLTAMLDVLPKLENCYSWILFLFENKIFVPDDVPSVERIGEKGYRNVSWPILSCLLACLKNKEPSEIEREAIVEFIQNSLIIVSDSGEIKQNDAVVNLLWEVYLTLGKSPETHDEKALWNDWAGSSDTAIYLVQDEYCAMIINNSGENAAENFSAFFAPGKLENQKHRSYWLKRLALKICSFHDNHLNGNILKNCITYLSDAIEPNSFYRSIEDRFHFDKDGYPYALLESIRCFLQAADEVDQNRVISGLISNATSTTQWQVALHLASLVSKGSVNDFVCNPLDNTNVFYDFYYWMNSCKGNFSKKDIDIIKTRIQNASFGYIDKHDAMWDASDEKWKNTWRYLLYDLLSSVDETANELKNAIPKDERFDKKSPIEDKEHYYTLQDVPPERYFEGVDFSGYDADDIYKAFLIEKGKSIWSNEFYHNQEIIEKIVTLIDDKQLISFFNCLLFKSINERCAVASLLSNDSIFNRFPHADLIEILKLLYRVICETDDSVKERNQLLHSFVYLLEHLEKANWRKEEILELIMSFDADMLFLCDESYHKDMDVVMNTINVAESQYYSLAIDCAAYCKQNETLKSQFFEWIQRTLIRVQHRKWRYYACAYQIQNLLYLDEKFVSDHVLPELNKSETPERIALLMCVRTSVIIPIVVSYISKDSRIEAINELIKDKATDNHDADRYINYMVAAYHFGHLQKSEFRRFIRLLDESAMNYVAWTIFEGIKGIEDGQCWQLVDGILAVLFDADIKAQFAKGVIVYSSRKQGLTALHWTSINKMIAFAYLKEGTWHAVEDCLEKTDADNPVILDVIEKMTKSPEEIYEYEADEILKELVRLKSMEAIKRFSGYLVGKNINPEKYSHFGESPENAVEYYKHYKK